MPGKPKKESKKTLKPDPSTEEKIKNAARLIFHKKGFAGARTRDIAEEAGINLALLNYYFRSKEKLFAIIMSETMQAFVQRLSSVLNDESLTLDRKIETIVDNYLLFLKEHSGIPLFILSELRANPDKAATTIGLKFKIRDTHFAQQLHARRKGKGAAINPVHFIINLMGLVIFPFVASPLLKNVAELSEKDFLKIMDERRALIPVWMKLMLDA